MMLGLINRNFKHMSISTFVALFKSMVRSHLDYCCPVWSPYRKGDIEALEKVQKRATKLIPVLKDLPYKDHLKACIMSTLHYRRLRGDTIKTYKILSGKYEYDTNLVPNLKTTGIQATWGNDLRIFKTRFKYDLHKFHFTNRVVDAWNTLPNWIVMANSTNTFKHRLDICHASDCQEVT